MKAISIFTISLFLMLSSVTASAIPLLGFRDDIDADADSQIHMFDASGNTFENLSFENYDNIVLYVGAIGDYGKGQLDEYVDILFEGSSLGRFDYSTPGISARSLGRDDSIDWQLQFAIKIPQIDWLAAIADGTLSIGWANGPGVHDWSSVRNGRNINDDYIGMTLIGERVSRVPEPASLSLLVLGLVALGLSRQRAS